MKSITLGFNKFKYIKGLVVGLIVGELTLIVLLSLVAIVMSNTGILNSTVLNILLTIICGVCAFVTGFISSKISPIKGYINGISSGFIFFLIIFSAGMISIDSNFTVFTFLKFIVSFLFGTIGGILGVSKKEKLIK